MTEQNENEELLNEFVYYDEFSEFTEEQVNFNLERMKKALEGPFWEIPKGLTREEMREHILEKAKEIKEKNKDE